MLLCRTDLPAVLFVGPFLVLLLLESEQQKQQQQQHEMIEAH